MEAGMMIQVNAGVRYWEDATVNGVEDEDGTRIPFRDGDRWRPLIDVDSGKIIDWPIGVTADIHYKVCDDGIYLLTTCTGIPLTELDDYVPDTMCPEPKGYGDYIIMKIDENGFIHNWKFNKKEFKIK
jgi:hypothetical protein